MSFVKGDSGSARELAGFLKNTMSAILESCESIRKSCGNLEEAWNDEGVEEAREAVNMIVNSVKKNAEDYVIVCRALLEYADFLDS